LNYNLATIKLVISSTQGINYRLVKLTGSYFTLTVPAFFIAANVAFAVVLCARLPTRLPLAFLSFPGIACPDPLGPPPAFNYPSNQIDGILEGIKIK
jgi:hypothetical protein